MKQYLLLFSLFLSVSLNAQNENISPVPHYEVVGCFSCNNYTVLYPLGWSENGDFAYIYQDVNGMGGAYIYHFQLIIQSAGGVEDFLYSEMITYNLEDDSTYHHYEDKLFDVSSEDDTAWYATSWMSTVLWPEHGERIDQILEDHKIKRYDEQAVYSLQHFEDRSMRYYQVPDPDTLDGWRIDERVDIYYQMSDDPETLFFTIENKLDEDGMTFDHSGKYKIDLLFYQIEGVIRSPVIDNLYYVYLVENTFGFEELAERLILIPVHVD